MKKVININFQGRVVPIEETAYEILQQYVDSLRRYFANEEGRDEIINDIESRIAELFAEVLKKGSTCITDEAVNNIIASMGRPEDFDGEEDHVKSQLGADARQSQTNTSYDPQEPRRLYRDETNKVLGGVCSGIANYFGIDNIIVRIIAVVTMGVVFLPYIILWVAIPSSATQVIGSTRKRLFRDPDNKIIAGVNGGLASYFGVNIWIPRVLFLIPFFSIAFRWSHIGFFDFPDFFNLSFSPGATIVYIILWLILPEANTAAEKLEMKGERVDLNSIKQTIQTDMDGFKGRAEKFGNEIKNKAQQFGQEVGSKGQQFGNEAGFVARRASRGLGDVIALIAKIFAYFILAVVLFAIVASLFGIGVVFIGFLPAKAYIINEGLENLYALGTLILFIWVPIIGIITWIVRRVAKLKSNSAIMRYSFLALWIAGWFCFMALMSTFSSNFKYRSNSVEESVQLTNPRIDKLEVKPGKFTKYYGSNHWFKIEPFASFDDDTVFVKNIRIRIIKSNTDSFQVNMIRLSDGKNKSIATALARKIDYTISQADTFLLLDKGIAINTTDKFRNQRVIVTIAVPVGKKILIRENAGWNENVFVGNNHDEGGFSREYGEEYNDWDCNVEYIMTTNGLERTHKKSTIDTESDDNNTLEEYKKSREELQREVEEKQRALEQQQRELEEKKKELSKPIDSTGKYRYQKTVHKIATQKSPTYNWCCFPNRLSVIES